MSTTMDEAQVGAFEAWLTRSPGRPRIRGRHQGPPTEPGLRFAFYGRTSTGRFQDLASSREWQRENALRAIAGRGRVVAEFFDVGYSRSLPWHHRPQAAALLQAVTNPQRGFDAVVIGEFERAFAADQARSIIAELHAYGVSVWLAEFGGPVNLGDLTHQALLSLLGHQAEREVLRARRRTTAAMCAQVRTQGRHLGGRPPYGYRLADAGPHPNPQHARWGRRLLRLDPDPETAPQVRWIFAQRLAGYSVAGIARTLNARGVPPPSAHDRARNPHRSGAAWTVRTVAAILANPRYTGRQVWRRQRIDHHEVRPGDKSSRLRGSRPTRCWNPRDQWEFSPLGAHPALVSDAAFLRVQQVSALPAPDDASTDRYQLTGLVICGLCGRRAEGHWAHGRARYRCRHGYTSASDAQLERAKVLYVRQDQIVAQAQVQFAHLIGGDPDDLGPLDLARQLRDAGITIVCTPVSITLDTGREAEPDETSLANQSETGELVLAGMTMPRQTAKNPHQNHPLNVNDFGGG
ncbi:recombinase family protein [Actinoplanes sp. NPDC051346]|uniref:recombinase family protein n=1 Tax=Actinoplanes sp. NPDC051346 TaxID=3155048 RepID=UPI0034188514